MKFNAASRQYMTSFFILITCFWTMYEYCKEKINFKHHLASMLPDSENIICTVIVHMSLKLLIEMHDLFILFILIYLAIFLNGWPGNVTLHKTTFPSWLFCLLSTLVSKKMYVYCEGYCEDVLVSSRIKAIVKQTCYRCCQF